MTIVRPLFIALALVTSTWTKADVLFESDDTLQFNLKADFELIDSERNKSRQYPGMLQIADSEIPLELEVRGNFRLKKSTCRYPPLRLNFKKEHVNDTLFDKQRRLKLVVQCSRRAVFEDYLRIEFLIYKMYSQLSDASFKVRWVEVGYQQFGSEEAPSVRPGFLIEQKKRMEKRLDMHDIKHSRVSHRDLVSLEANLIDLFQFMIGNTDYSLLEGEGEGEDKEACCHNAKLLTKKKDETPYLPVPYDFDNAGLINARYATPNEALGTSSVTQRRYRGFCIHNNLIPQNLETLRQHKETFFALLRDDPLLSSKSKKRTVRYLEGFYDVIDSDSRLKRQISGRCRG